jgi:hypothetical protein
MIFKAKSDITERTLLLAGLFNDGEPNIIPLIFSYLFYLTKANEISEPTP